MNTHTDLPEAAELYLDSNRGVYIPQQFFEITKSNCVSGISEKNIEACKAGPDCEEYWEAWEEVLDNAVITDPVTEKRYMLWQDEDLWLIPTI